MHNHGSDQEMHDGESMCKMAHKMPLLTYTLVTEDKCYMKHVKTRGWRYTIWHFYFIGLYFPDFKDLKIL